MVYRSRWRMDAGPDIPNRVASDAARRAPRKGEHYSPIEHGWGSGRHHAADTGHGASYSGANPDGRPVKVLGRTTRGMAAWIEREGR